MKKTITVNEQKRSFIMGDLMAYIQKLELFGFFSGYCLLYSLIFSFQKPSNSKAQTLLEKVAKLLPYAYALTATLYAAMIVKNISLNISIRNFKEQFQLPYLQIIALLALLFWIPFFSKRKILSLLHSLVFFTYLLMDIFLLSQRVEGKELMYNDMKLFTDSLLLNLTTIILVVILHFFFTIYRKKRDFTA
ncbi:MAG: hypothetical protein ACTHNG_12040 [Ginsengibacter sp.]